MRSPRLPRPAVSRLGIKLFAIILLVNVAIAGLVFLAVSRSLDQGFIEYLDQTQTRRAETLADKPAFREALRGRRAVVPADGFFEWQAAGRAKRPHWIRRRDGGLLALAGLWQRWQGEREGMWQTLDTFTIVVGPANATLTPIHERMPVILDAAAREHWLDPTLSDSDRLRPLLTPYSDEALEAVPVSTRVNNPANDDPSLLEADPTDGGVTPPLF